MMLWDLALVIAQTYPVKEIIVVDDGSIDQSLAIARGYGATVSCLSQNFTKDSVFSSFLSPNNLRTIQFEDTNTVSRVENVQMHRHLFLKMDTQGFDLEVVRGAGAYLEQTVADSVRGIYDPDL